MARARTIGANGIALHAVEEGEGPPVVLLHGFPDTHLSWRRQLPAIAAAGHRAVALDLRGYGASTRPRSVRAYAMDALVRDVHDAIQALGAEQAVVVGHDWGGIIAWYLAMWHPEVVRGLVVLDAPHPAAYVRELARPSSQLLRSWYAFAFQLPFLPEALLAAGDRALMDLVLRSGPARHDDVLDAYRAAFATRDAITAGIDYYRAYVRHPPPAPVPIRVPTRLIWALADPFLVPSLRHGLAPWVQPLDVVTVADAGHWLHHSHAAEVNAWLLEFLAALPETTDRAAA